MCKFVSLEDGKIYQWATEALVSLHSFCFKLYLGSFGLSRSFYVEYIFISVHKVPQAEHHH